jgi:cytosine/adenosine deaminase-related metal-dependent hydrolase
MATVNGGILLGKKIGSIETGYLADVIFVDKHAIDLEPMHNPHASLVHRASESDIKAVMVGGKIVHGKL